MKVRVLEDHVVDRIAAGEVVERPASVLKELLENALDAGATRIHVLLERGGTSLVRIVDDGEGMSREDALLAIERHATSKIRTDADLVGIVTLGFRGEALPSIASVTRMTLRTRRAEDEVGTELKLEGGRLLEVREVAMPVGTDIAARALFFNTPARRRFLRTVPTELTHLLDLVRREVLLRPSLDVTVKHDGREVLRAPASEDGAHRVASLLGEDVRGALRAVDHAEEGIRVWGYVADPTVSRSSAAQAVYTWVGGRYVRDPLLRRAIAEAARSRAVSGRHPVVALSVDVAPGEVDVNVHPAKTEVRFRQPRQVSDVVTRAVLSAWTGGRALPERPLRGEVPGDRGPDLFSGPARAVSTLSPLPPENASQGGTAPLGPLPSWARDPGPVLEEADEVAPVAAEPSPEVEVPAAVPVLPVQVLHVDDGIALARQEGRLWLVDVAGLVAAEPGPSRPLLLPVAVRLSREVLQAVLARVELLEDGGVGVRAFAPGEVALTALPQGVRTDDGPALLEALARVDTAEEVSAALAPFVDVVATGRVEEAVRKGITAGVAREVAPGSLRAWWASTDG